MQPPPRERTVSGLSPNGVGSSGGSSRRRANRLAERTKQHPSRAMWWTVARQPSRPSAVGALERSSPFPSSAVRGSGVELSRQTAAPSRPTSVATTGRRVGRPASPRRPPGRPPSPASVPGRRRRRRPGRRPCGRGAGAHDTAGCLGTATVPPSAPAPRRWHPRATAPNPAGRRRNKRGRAAAAVADTPHLPADRASWRRDVGATAPRRRPRPSRPSPRGRATRGRGARRRGAVRRGG